MPFLISVAWMLYTQYKAETWTIVSGTTQFSAAFFFTAWISGNIFRILKQRKVERNLRGIEDRLIGLVDRVEERTADLLNHITGGESFCYLTVGKVNDEYPQGSFFIVHHGKHPLYDVTMHVCDLNKLRAAPQPGQPIDFEEFYTSMKIGDLIPGHGQKRGAVGLGDAENYSASVTITARNGTVLQLLRMVKKDGEWLRAIRVKRGAKVIFEQVPHGYPAGLLTDDEWKNFHESDPAASGHISIPVSRPRIKST